MKPHEVKIGMRVLIERMGAGTVVDDYWRHRDRFKVRLDNGTELDFGAYSLKAAPPPVLTTMATTTSTTSGNATSSDQDRSTL